ncbi:MAG: peptide/nickel transport system permease protein [Thermomicrobiales bacterium]|jgi:peptide/nickel transport system permease protein|nr:peptide/nickel transport system permease protein [Thermomicrobiales bacterium]
MLSYVTLRLLQGVVVIFLVSITSFIIMQIAPGSPVDIMIGEQQVTQEQIDAITHKWGLDRPWYVQYFTWLGNVFTGDFGQSVIRTGVPVRHMIAEAAPVTLRLNLLSLVVSVAVAVPIGVLAAIKRYSWFDYSSMVGSTLGIALPNYWVGLMLIIVFSLKLGWLPPYGSDTWKSYVLPVSVLATQEMAILARLTRGATAEVFSQDYVTTARAKGLRESFVVGRHVVRNSLLPVVTILGYRIAFILSGTIVVETVFAWPGIGQLFFSSIDRKDYQVVQAIVLLLATIVVVSNIVTDLLYAYIDPRIRIR